MEKPVCNSLDSVSSSDQWYSAGNLPSLSLDTSFKLGCTHPRFGRAGGCALACALLVSGAGQLVGFMKSSLESDASSSSSSSSLDSSSDPLVESTTMESVGSLKNNSRSQQGFCKMISRT